MGPKLKAVKVDLAAYAQPDLADLDVEHPRDRSMRGRGGYGEDRGPRGSREDDLGDDWRAGRPLASQTYGLERSYGSRGSTDRGEYRPKGYDRSMMRDGDRPFDRGGPSFDRGGPSFDRRFERGPPHDRDTEEEPTDWRSSRPAAAAPSPSSAAPSTATAVSGPSGGPKRRFQLGAVSTILSTRVEGAPSSDVAAEPRRITAEDKHEEEKKVKPGAEEAEESQAKPEARPEVIAEFGARPRAQEPTEHAERESGHKAEKPRAGAEAETAQVSVVGSKEAEAAETAKKEAVTESKDEVMAGSKEDQPPAASPGPAVEAAPKKKRLQISMDDLHRGKGLMLSRTKTVDRAAEPLATSTQPSQTPPPRSIMDLEERSQDPGYSGTRSRDMGGPRRLPYAQRSTEGQRPGERSRFEEPEVAPAFTAQGVSMVAERVGSSSRPARKLSELVEPRRPTPKPAEPPEEPKKKPRQVSDSKAAMRAKKEELERVRKEKASAQRNAKSVREEFFQCSVNDFNAVVVKLEPCFQRDEPIDEREAVKLVKAIGDISKKIWRSTAVLIAIHLLVIKKLQLAAIAALEEQPNPAEGQSATEHAEHLLETKLISAAEAAVAAALPLLEAVHEKQESLFGEDFVYVNIQCMMRTFGTSGISRLAPSVSLAELVLLAWLKLNRPLVTKELILEFYDDKEDETEGRAKALTQMLHLVGWLREQQDGIGQESSEEA